MRGSSCRCCVDPTRTMMARTSLDKNPSGIDFVLEMRAPTQFAVDALSPAGPTTFPSSLTAIHFTYRQGFQSGYSSSKNKWMCQSTSGIGDPSGARSRGGDRRRFPEP